MLVLGAVYAVAKGNHKNGSQTKGGRVATRWHSSKTAKLSTQGIEPAKDQAKLKVQTKYAKVMH